MILSVLTTLSYDINYVVLRIFKEFKEKYELKIPLEEVRKKIEIVISEYINGYVNYKFERYDRLSDGKNYKKVIDYLSKKTGFTPYFIQTVLDELESLAKESITAQKVLTYPREPKEIEKIKEIQEAQKAGIFPLTFPKPLIDINVEDIKKVLIFVIIILLLIYFAPAISNIVSRLTTK